MPQIARSEDTSMQGRGATVAMFVSGVALAGFDKVF